MLQVTTTQLRTDLRIQSVFSVGCNL